MKFLLSGVAALCLMITPAMALDAEAKKAVDNFLAARDKMIRSCTVAGSARYWPCSCIVPAIEQEIGAVAKARMLMTAERMHQIKSTTVVECMMRKR